MVQVKKNRLNRATRNQSFRLCNSSVNALSIFITTPSFGIEKTKRENNKANKHNTHQTMWISVSCFPQQKAFFLNCMYFQYILVHMNRVTLYRKKINKTLKKDTGGDPTKTSNHYIILSSVTLALTIFLCKASWFISLHPTSHKYHLFLIIHNS